MLTSRQMEILKIMFDAEKVEDAETTDPTEVYTRTEIVCDRLSCYLGDIPISWRTIRALLNVVAISDRSISGDTGRIFRLNDIGRSITRRPELADEVQVSLFQGASVTVKDDRLVKLD